MNDADKGTRKVARCSRADRHASATQGDVKTGLAAVAVSRCPERRWRTILRAGSFGAVGLGLAISLAGCARERSQQPPENLAAAAPASVPLQPTAGIRDIMAFIVDPSADALWEAVSTVSNAAGTREHVPRTEDEWRAVRGHAITLMESSNLLAMEGRHVAVEGSPVDADAAGNLTAAQSEQAIAADRASFVAFAHALHDVSYQMLKAIDTKDPAALMDYGASLDEVCEGCHLKFWYPPR